MMKAQSLMDVVEEVAQPTPQKSKKKQMGKGEVGSRKTNAHERTPSLIKQRKGVDEVQLLRRKKGRKKFLNQLWNLMSMLTSTPQSQVEM
jgi:hypothetical protein